MELIANISLSDFFPSLTAPAESPSPPSTLSAAEQQQCLDQAQQLLSLISEGNESEERVMPVIVDLLQKAADHQSAIDQLHTLWFKGQGITKDNFNAAVSFLSEFADQDAAVNYQLGVLYFEGKVTETDFSQAFTHFKFAAERRHAEAAFFVGQMYEKGLVPLWDRLSFSSNEEMAKKYYQLAIAAGHPEAQKRFNLLVAEPLYRKGIGDKSDISWERLDLVRKAADLGHTKAMFRFAISQYALLTNRDYYLELALDTKCSSTVLTYLKMAKENGHKRATIMFNLHQCALEYQNRGTIGSAYALANCLYTSKDWIGGDIPRRILNLYQQITRKIFSTIPSEKEIARNAAYRLYELLKSEEIQVSDYQSGDSPLFSKEAKQADQIKRYLGMAADAGHQEAQRILGDQEVVGVDIGSRSVTGETKRKH